MNAYVYAPKDDPRHRAQWREPYDAAAAAQLRELASACAAVRGRFGFALSPGLDIDYGSADDRAALLAKLVPLLDSGVDWFVLALDDIPPRPNLAADQVELTNWLLDALRGRDAGVRLTLVPTEYVGTRPSEYLSDLARGLPADVDVMWTGPTVCSPRITTDDALAWQSAVGGHPLLLWDNYPVNDGVMARELHLGAYRGRDAGLAGVLDGVLCNPMVQPRASLVALATAAEFLCDPAAYDEDAAWERAIAAVGGKRATSLQALARGCADGPLRESRELDAHRGVAELAAALDGPDWAAPLDGLRIELEALRAGPTRTPPAPMPATVLATVTRTTRSARSSRPGSSRPGERPTPGSPHSASASSCARSRPGAPTAPGASRYPMPSVRSCTPSASCSRGTTHGRTRRPRRVRATVRDPPRGGAARGRAPGRRRRVGRPRGRQRCRPAVPPRARRVRRVDATAGPAAPGSRRRSDGGRRRRRHLHHRPGRRADAPVRVGLDPAHGCGRASDDRLETAVMLTVVMPAFNEAAMLESSVRDVTTGLRARGEPFEVIVVENGSTDGTLDVARRIVAANSAVRALHRPIADYGAALRAGLLEARGDVVVNFDVDYYDLDFLADAVDAGACRPWARDRRGVEAVRGRERRAPVVAPGSSRGASELCCASGSGSASPTPTA